MYFHPHYGGSSWSYRFKKIFQKALSAKISNVVSGFKATGTCIYPLDPSAIPALYILNCIPYANDNVVQICSPAPCNPDETIAVPNTHEMVPPIAETSTVPDVSDPNLMESAIDFQTPPLSLRAFAGYKLR